MTLVIAAIAIAAALLVLAYLWLIRPVQEAQERTLVLAESARREARESRVHASA
jgi:heme exporter protein D